MKVYIIIELNIFLLIKILWEIAVGANDLGFIIVGINRSFWRFLVSRRGDVAVPDPWVYLEC